MDYSKAVMLAAGISSLEKVNIFLPRSFRESVSHIKEQMHSIVSGEKISDKVLFIKYQ